MYIYIYIPSAWSNQISVFVTTRIYNIIVLHILHWYCMTSIPVTMKIIVIKMCMMHITLAVSVCTSISWHLLAVHFAYRALCVQRGRQREGGREGGRKTERGRERGRDTLMHSCTYSHPACMCLDQIQSAAREEHHELHQCPAKGEGGRVGQGAEFDEQHRYSPGCR